MHGRSIKLSQLWRIVLYQDVREYFDDGLFNDWGTPYFMESTGELIEKIAHVRASYSASQRDCVARAVVLVESASIQKLDAEFSRRLGRFASFWKIE